MTEDTIQIRVLPLSQPIGEFYVGVVSAKDLREICYADIRRISDRKFETYTGIQRPLSQKRVAEIKSYIETVDATFPNSIIVTIKSVNVSEMGEDTLTVKRHKDAVKIIDGQHRLAGFDEENSKDFELIVAIFLDLEEEDQASIFSTINLKQTKVSRSLVYDLFDLEVSRSPQKTAHDMAKALNKDPKSGLYKRIKILGTKPKDSADSAQYAFISQGTFVQYLLPQISENPDEDRDLLKRKKTPRLVGDEVARGLIFRQYFVEEKDWAILKILMNYFMAVASVFNREWTDTNSPLARTIGYAALMKTLPYLFLEGHNRNDLSLDFFTTKLTNAYRKAKESPQVKFTFEEFPASGVGENKLFKKLLSLLEVEGNE